MHNTLSYYILVYTTLTLDDSIEYFDKKTKEPIEIMGKKSDFEEIGDIENMKIIRSKLKVLARSRPNDKYIMVSGLK